MTVKSVQTLGVAYLGFDFRVNDSYGFQDFKNPTSDVRVRKAMYHAIDIDALIDHVSNRSVLVPVSQFVTHSTFGYNPGIQRVPYDKEYAMQLLRDAGYSDGFVIELDCLDSNRSIDICSNLKDQLAEVNITVNVNPLPDSEYYSKLYFKNTSFYLTAFTPLNAERTIELFLYTSDMQENMGIWNYGNYSNPEVDKLYDILSYTLDPESRKALIHDVFSIAIEDVAWIPLYSGNAFYGVRATIEWSPRPALYVLFNDMSFSD